MFISSAFTVATVSLNLLWLHVQFLQKSGAVGGFAIGLSWNCNDSLMPFAKCLILKAWGQIWRSVAVNSVVFTSVHNQDGQMLSTSYKEKPDQWHEHFASLLKFLSIFIETLNEVFHPPQPRPAGSKTAQALYLQEHPVNTPEKSSRHLCYFWSESTTWPDKVMAVCRHLGQADDSSGG